MRTGAPPTQAYAPGEETAHELAVRYESYRLRQAIRLVQMLPRGAVRPLYRLARLEAEESEEGVAGGVDDPLGLLVRYCEHLLPLPPFEIWRDDLLTNPRAHVDDLEDSAVGPTAAEPTTLDERTFLFGGRAWKASLRSYRDAELWRAFISFEGPSTTAPHRTAPLFCERELWALLERFASFETAALQAFLRSALP
jgi:hypothetical protein